MRRWRRSLLPFALLAALLAVGVWLRPSASKPVMTVNCVDLTQLCKVGLPGQTLVIRADGAPSALKPFRLQVSGSSLPLTARFGMEGMEMGPLQTGLQPQPDGSQAAEVILPLCAQGRRDWQLWLDGEAGRLAIRFITIS